MSKYMVLFSSTVPTSELMANSSPEQMKASMNEWISWRDEAIKTVKFEFGLPLQAVSHITPNSSKPSDSHISGYATMEADSKEAILELLKTHPHLKREGASIEVLEMLSMPGL